MNKRLKYQLFKSVGVENNQTTKLTEAPPIKQKDMGKFNVLIKYAVVMADLIYLRPDPQGYEYVLTVVDIATRAMDAIPLKGRTSQDVIEGFEQVFKHKYITEDIMILYADNGTDFKNKAFHDYMKDKGITVRHTMAYRKSQTGPVEFINHLITKTLYSKMTTVEIDTKEEYSEWAKYLPNIVKVLNEKENLKTPKLSDFFKEPKATAKEIDNRLEVGTVVFYRLQKPQDHLPERNATFHGGFRNGDRRWSMEPTEISQVLILPNQPIGYMVKAFNNVRFIRKELLVADEKTTAEYRAKHPLQNTQNTNDAQPEPLDVTTHKGPITRSMARKTNTVIK